MNVYMLVLGGFFFIGIVIMVALALSKKVYRLALGSSLAIFTAMVASMKSPSVQGAVDVHLDFGALGYIQGAALQVNPPTSTFESILALIGVIAIAGGSLYLNYMENMATLGSQS